MASAQNLVVVSDFDGTITQEDVCLALLDRFAAGDWQRLENEYGAGRISLEECLLGQVGMLTAPREALVAFAHANGRLRSGFAEFVAFCGRVDVGLAVVSAGLDFYINTILAREGLSGLDVTCVGTTDIGGRVSLQLPLAGYEKQEGVANFKAAAVRARKAAGKLVVYVGDGYTDFAPAREADYVFARENLLAYCRREGVACSEFADFGDVQRGVALLLGRPTVDRL